MPEDDVVIEPSASLELSAASSTHGGTRHKITMDETISTSTEEEFHWTPSAIAQSIVLFFLAGTAEIVGGWMIWYVYDPFCW
jgi:hypothetical protein